MKSPRVSIATIGGGIIMISIYTPTYNRHDLLQERAIPSVLSQTHEDWEYIIVSDGKDEELREIVESYDEPRFRYFDIPRVEPPHEYDNKRQWFLGACHPANHALSKVRGDWIARLDDDDMWAPRHLERSLTRVIKHGYDFLTSAYVIVEGNKGILFDSPRIKDFLRLHDSPRKINPKVGCHSSWFYSSRLRHLRYDPNCIKKKWNRVADTDLLERMYERGVSMGFLDEVLTFIIPRPGCKHVGLNAVREAME